MAEDHLEAFLVVNSHNFPFLLDLLPTRSVTFSYSAKCIVSLYIGSCKLATDGGIQDKQATVFFYLGTWNFDADAFCEFFFCVGNKRFL